VHTNSVNNAVYKPTVKNMVTVRIFDIMCKKFKFPKRKINELHNEELHKLYSSLSIMKMIKSRRMIWAWHVAQMGRRVMHVEYSRESHKERDQ
jgi:hypothetical protein